MAFARSHDRFPPCSGPILQTGTRRPIYEAMVFFTHPTLDSEDLLSVSTGYEPDGYRLVLDFPDGRQLIHLFFSQPDLYRGTAILQSDLVDDGWQLAEPPGHRSTLGLPSQRRPDPHDTEM